MNQLSLRLEAILNMVTPKLRVADIGCDHGLLGIALRQRNIAPAVLACDINEGPLLHARANVAAEGVDGIEFRLTDGLCGIAPCDAQCIVIAGMGGPLMESILSAQSEIAHSASELILSPQSDIEHFRRYLQENGYRIVSEDMVYDEHKYYVILKVNQGRMCWENTAEFRYGKILLREQHPILHQFLLDEKQYFAKLLNEFSMHDKTERVLIREAEVVRDLNICTAALEYVDRTHEVEITRELV